MHSMLPHWDALGELTVRLVAAFSLGALIGLERQLRQRTAGFAPALVDQILTAFWTTKAQGLGLGLGISRMLVEAQGGQISAHNDPEGGARFCFSLPLVQGKE